MRREQAPVSWRSLNRAQERPEERTGGWEREEKVFLLKVSGESESKQAGSLYYHRHL